MKKAKKAGVDTLIAKAEDYAAREIARREGIPLGGGRGMAKGGPVKAKPKPKKEEYDEEGYWTHSTRIKKNYDRAQEELNKLDRTAPLFRADVERKQGAMTSLRSTQEQSEATLDQLNAKRRAELVRRKQLGMPEEANQDPEQRRRWEQRDRIEREKKEHPTTYLAKGGNVRKPPKDPTTSRRKGYAGGGTVFDDSGKSRAEVNAARRRGQASQAEAERTRQIEMEKRYPSPKPAPKPKTPLPESEGLYGRYKSKGMAKGGNVDYPPADPTARKLSRNPMVRSMQRDTVQNASYAQLNKAGRPPPPLKPGADLEWSKDAAPTGKRSRFK